VRFSSGASYSCHYDLTIPESKTTEPGTHVLGMARKPKSIISQNPLKEAAGPASWMSIRTNTHTLRIEKYPALGGVYSFYLELLLASLNLLG
jgi:hypothetical protein